MKEPKNEARAEETIIVEANTSRAQEEKAARVKTHGPDLHSHQYMTREELVEELAQRSGIEQEKVRRFTDVFIKMLAKRSTVFPVLSRIASFASPSPYHDEEKAFFQDQLPWS